MKTVARVSPWGRLSLVIAVVGALCVPLLIWSPAHALKKSSLGRSGFGGERFVPGKFIWLMESWRASTRTHRQLEPLRVFERTHYRSTIGILPRLHPLLVHRVRVDDSKFVLRGIPQGNLLSAEHRPGRSGDTLYLPGWRQDMTFRSAVQRLTEATPASLNVIVSRLRESAMFIVRYLPEADRANRVVLTQKSRGGALVDSFETTVTAAVEQLNEGLW